ncbi:MAG: DUF1934 domain-containing protein [Ruminococcus flavefaciens]|nr:DUF1934 domain-containing protein [Ruminococcus flavefaciens]
MKKNQLISLVSIQIQDGEKTESELFTNAEINCTKNYITITYEDTEATGFEGSVTSVKVTGNKEASVIRTGTSNSILTMETGKKHYCQYGTPFGMFQIGVYTQAIENTLSENGRLYLKYTLDLNASKLSDNEIIITIQNTDKKGQ